MQPKIASLITEIDNVELIRDQIAAILRLELDNQVALAQAESVDPAPWTVDVYTERSGAFESGLNDPNRKTPFVNVWIDNESWDRSASNVMERQRGNAFINVDAVGYGTRKPGEAGDFEAATSCQRVLRLCRKILMAAPYTYLELRGIVASRWPQSRTYYQPTIDQAPVQNVYGGRFTMVVDFNEFSPQTTPETLEVLAVQLQRAETGEVYFDAEYNYT